MYPYPSGDLHIGHWYIVTPDRRDRALPPDARRERVPADRVRRVRAARGERRDQGRLPPARVDDAQHREHAPAVPDDGRDVRLVVRGRDLRPRLLPLEPVVLPAVPEGRARVSIEVAGRLVPERRHAGARAGRGHRSALLALRLEGREARPGPVVPARHEVRGRAARLHRRSSSRIRFGSCRRTGSGGRRAARSCSRRRHPTTTRAARRSASSRPGRTRCSGRRSWSSRPSTRWSRR